MRRHTVPVVAVLTLGLSFVAAGAVSAQSIPAHPNDLTYELLDFTPPEAADHRHVLPNGVVTFVVEDHELPLVSISLLIRTGAYLDPPDKIGLASLTGSQLRAGGTTTMSATDFDEEAAFLAASIGSNIGATSGGASLNCLTKDLDTCLDLFFDMLRNPGFDEGRLALATSRSVQQMERRNDSTGSIEGREWGRLMRGDEHFSTRPRTRATVEAITRDDLVAFHRRYYHPGNFIFSASGDLETSAILAELERRMAGWTVGTESVPPVPAQDVTPEPGLYLVDKPDVNQGRVAIGHLGTTRDDPDRYKLLVMNDILGGGGFSARLLTRIRSDEGLAYSASSNFGVGVYYKGVFQAGFQSRSETVARATAIVLEEIERIRTEPVGEEELRNSIAYFVETFSRNFSSAASTAGLFASDEYTGRDPAYLAVYRDNIAAVTAEHVLDVAQRYLDPDELAILVVGNLEAILAGDPERPEYMLEDMSRGEVVRIPLPDPFTMEYPDR
ncbi:MAG: peptidase M16 [Acidobacteria bacterium]|nr:peptidase M16 [Acidobacteriota bacterium]HJN46029.1 pitrilysin family protein [Vicinamibacterales bacterium]